MPSFDSIPQARVVRKGGQLFTPPPQQERNAATEQVRTVLAYAIGMWPLTGVVLLALGLIIMAGNGGAP